MVDSMRTGYLLNGTLDKLWTRYGPLPEKRFTRIPKNKSGTVYILCPGVSLDFIDLGMLKDKTVFSVNLAWFLIPSIIVVAECRFSIWWCSWLNKVDQLWHDKEAIFSPRAAVWAYSREQIWGSEGKRVQLASHYWLAPWIEDGYMQLQTASVGTVSAILAAWKFGYSRAVLVGMDLCSEKGRKYTKKVPKSALKSLDKFNSQYVKRRYSRKVKRAKELGVEPTQEFIFGKQIPLYKKQAEEIGRVETPGMEVVNCSERSKKRLPFRFMDLKEACKQY